MKDYLNINEASRLTGLSIPTIRSKLSKGLLPGASQVQDGKRSLWRIPLTDLVAAGLVDKVRVRNQLTDQLDRVEGVEADYDRISAELEATKELLRRADQTIEDYRNRERYLFSSIETKSVQDQRRSLWQRVTNR
jgi:DNA-binding transcriptional ArsR family regulator